MGRSREGICGRGLHDLGNPLNVGIKPCADGTERLYCLPCGIATRRYRALPPLTQMPTRQQLAVLQDMAWGMTVAEIAERDGQSTEAVRNRVRRARLKLPGTPTTAAAAVAVCLAYELITPDTSGPLPPRDRRTARYALSVLDLVQGRRGPLVALYRHRGLLLDALYAWSEPHAVSVLWAAGTITPRDVAPLFAKRRKRQ